MASKTNKKIAILTSGGDASSMNKVVETFVRYSIKNGYEPYFVYRGFEGLYKNNIKKATLKDVKGISSLPGTIIKSARFPEFQDQKYRIKAAQNLKQKGIDTLVVCGGNGSYFGAQKLSLEGINVIGIPGTIDNDIASSELTVGFDSALNIVIDQIFAVRSTLESHDFIGIVEIMGRDCPDLTMYASVCTNADICITKDTYLSPEQLTQEIKKIRKTNKNSILILTSELIYGKDGKPSLSEVSSYVQSKLGEKIRVSVLGYLQRGGKPSAMDLYIASSLTVAALDHLIAGNKNFVVGFNKFQPTFIDITKAVNMKEKISYELVDKIVK